MGKIGDSIERREDTSLITGNAEYLDDLSEPQMGYMAILRSQYAQATIEDIDTSKAKDYGSITDVFTHKDIKESGIPGNIPVGTSLPGSEGSQAHIRKPLEVPERPLLATDEVHYQGQPIAVVVARDRYDAYNAIDSIDVEYDRQEAITDPDEALKDEAPAIHQDIPNNLAFDWEVGDSDAVEDSFEDAHHIVSVKRDRQRLIGNSIEPRGALAKYKNRQLTVAMSTQVPHLHQSLLSHVLDLPESRIRVWTPDVGGGFGVKSKYYPGELLAAWCSIQTGKPVKWQATRSESFLSDCQGRGHVGEAKLALDEDGEIIGLKVDDKKDLGAFVQRAAPSVNTGSYATLLSSQYTITDIYCRVRGVFTNLTPTDAYRGSSRPEGCYIIERLMNKASQELDIDPVELRRKNLIPSNAFPYETPVLAEYDSGDYEKQLELVCGMVDYDEFRERQSELREEDQYVGIGIACFVEPAGSSPPGDPAPAGKDAPTRDSPDPGIESTHIESSEITIYPDGSVIAYTGTSDQGQGHETTYAQILASKLGIDYENIEIREGDTDQAAQGTGSHSSRSVVMAGNSFAKSADKIIEKGRLIAAHLLDTNIENIEFNDGEFSIADSSDHSIHFTDIAEESYRANNLPEGVEPGLTSETYYGSEGKTWPSGTHVAIVEVDTETGDISLKKYAAVDDCGVQINPKLVEGQIEGGVVQGIGQALLEEAVYDDNGNLITGSLQDYAMPRAESVPEINVDHTVSPSPRNPLGVKGTGEAGTVGAPIAVLNAVLDALKPFGVESLSMPISPEEVYNSIQENNP